VERSGTNRCDLSFYLLSFFENNSKLMEMKINYVSNDTEQNVVCDTNVWYWIAMEKYEKPENTILSPTSLSLYELASSEIMASNLKFYQDVLLALNRNSSGIIVPNPFDYVLYNNDHRYPLPKSNIEEILKVFSKILSKEISDDIKLSEEDKSKIIENCRKVRRGTEEFAEFGTEQLINVRKNINKGIGKKEHLKLDATDINKEMMKSFLNDYLTSNNIEYTIDFENFDWSKIDFFMTVTGNYFKKLETTKGMKVHANDGVDWLNMLYVRPNDKYLTFETSWRKLILGDEKTKHLLLA
jgi:hypothetical protein